MRATSTQPPEGFARAALAATTIPALGAAAVGLWLRDWPPAAAAYYALLLLAVASPEGAPLRAALTRGKRLEEPRFTGPAGWAQQANPGAAADCEKESGQSGRSAISAA